MLQFTSVYLEKIQFSKFQGEEWKFGRGERPVAPTIPLLQYSSYYNFFFMLAIQVFYDEIFLNARPKIHCLIKLIYKKKMFSKDSEVKQAYNIICGINEIRKKYATYFYNRKELSQSHWRKRDLTAKPLKKGLRDYLATIHITYFAISSHYFT